MEVDQEFLNGIETLTEEQYEAVKNVIAAFNGTNLSDVKKVWLSTEEAAEELGLTSATVRTYLTNGKLEGRRLSERKMVVSSESVKRMRLAQSRF